MNDLVAEVERRSKDDPERLRQVKQAFEVIQEDIRDEEDFLLPQLQEILDVAQRRRPASGAVRQTAPTWPHAGAELSDATAFRVRL
ncbi:hypothetical protein [Streptomyces sp. NPDC102487]|uniref:hypothetical protein n=1 Tax=Streptomyces sp. NPDC102487 TaxID=3366182 RepID=UPI00381C67D6